MTRRVEVKFALTAGVTISVSAFFNLDGDNVLQVKADSVLCDVM